KKTRQEPGQITVISLMRRFSESPNQGLPEDRLASRPDGVIITILIFMSTTVFQLFLRHR
ncbi:hypothetical protein ACTXNP_23450, partial [Pseudomonas helleri]|uniref:hypothetical protein n=1 Tax=Pseudomonas helleri TaxID=1608996 RepID=UPI003FCF2EE5